MSGYPLKSVLELRRREEEAARAQLADATHKVAEAEAEAALRERRQREARARLEQAERELRAIVGDETPRRRAGGGSAAGASAAVPAGASSRTAESAAAGARFVTRRRSEWQRLQAEAASFRAGPLALARAAEEAARVQVVAARQAREAFQRHEARFVADRRRAADGREQEQLDEAAIAAIAVRRRRDPANRS